ncbi:hypothetical protein ACFRIC_09405 [Streptomyces sp. NPDC056738]|uniref:hypothetical protein n=1 Tax=Streptomyces sp. NPDC056738 TaxID=3345933 RepID=UPI00368730E5
MPRQLEQLPTDPTTLAREIAALKRQMREMRAARRMVAASIGTLRVYAADGTTLLAELGPSEDGGGGLSTFGVTEVDGIPVVAALSSGRLRFQSVDEEVVAVPGFAAFTAIAGGSCDLMLASGSPRATDWAAVVDLTSGSDGGRPTVLVAGTRTVGGVGESGACDMDVAGVLTAGNMAFGQVSITPSAANTPTSINVTGLSLQGTTFLGYASAATTVPGTQVTGVGATSPSSTGLTVWATRTNTTATLVNWWVFGV